MVKRSNCKAENDHDRKECSNCGKPIAPLEMDDQTSTYDTLSHKKIDIGDGDRINIQSIHIHSIWERFRFSILIIVALVSILIALIALGVWTVMAGFPPWEDTSELHHENYGLILNSLPGNGGSIIQSPLPNVNNEYEKGERVTLEARPSDGYRFIRWSGDIGGTRAIETIVMSGDKQVYAEFESERVTIDSNKE